MEMIGMTGRAIGEGFKQGMRNSMVAGAGTELLYSVIIIACSLMIYFGTKELYKLSSHKGIKYFRLAFLYFALAYFFRYSIKFIFQFIDRGTVFAHPNSLMFIGGIIPLAAFMYFSSMGLLYILYSVNYNKFDKNSKILTLFQVAAIVITIIGLVFRNPLVYLGLNLILLLFSLISVLISQKNKKKKNNLHAIYILLLIFWIFNIVDLLVPNFLQTFQLLIYVASIIIFLVMLYKVLRKCGAK